MYSAPTASMTAFVAGKFRVQNMSQKKSQKTSSMCIVSRKEFLMGNGVFTQIDDSGEYAGLFPSAEAIHQVDKINVHVSNGLKYR
jgi:hypothetical protein